MDTVELERKVITASDYESDGSLEYTMDDILDHISDADDEIAGSRDCSENAEGSRDGPENSDGSRDCQANSGASENETSDQKVDTEKYKAPNMSVEHKVSESVAADKTAGVERDKPREVDHAESHSCDTVSLEEPADTSADSNSVVEQTHVASPQPSVDSGVLPEEATTVEEQKCIDNDSLTEQPCDIVITNVSPETLNGDTVHPAQPETGETIVSAPPSGRQDEFDDGFYDSSELDKSQSHSSVVRDDASPTRVEIVTPEEPFVPRDNTLPCQPEETVTKATEDSVNVNDLQDNEPFSDGLSLNAITEPLVSSGNKCIEVPRTDHFDPNENECTFQLLNDTTEIVAAAASEPGVSHVQTEIQTTTPAVPTETQSDTPNAQTKTQSDTADVKPESLSDTPDVRTTSESDTSELQPKSETDTQTESKTELQTESKTDTTELDIDTKHDTTEIDTETKSDKSDLHMTTQQDSPDVQTDKPDTSEVQTENKPDTPDAQTEITTRTPELQIKTKLDTHQVQSESKPETPEVQTGNDSDTPDSHTESKCDTPDVPTEIHTESADIKTETQPDTPDVQTETKAETFDVQTEFKLDTSVVQTDSNAQTIDVGFDSNAETSKNQDIKFEAKVKMSVDKSVNTPDTPESPTDLKTDTPKVEIATTDTKSQPEVSFVAEEPDIYALEADIMLEVPSMNGNATFSRPRNSNKKFKKQICDAQNLDSANNSFQDSFDVSFNSVVDIDFSEELEIAEAEKQDDGVDIVATRDVATVQEALKPQQTTELQPAIIESEQTTSDVEKATIDATQTTSETQQATSVSNEAALSSRETCISEQMELDSVVCSDQSDPKSEQPTHDVDKTTLSSEQTTVESEETVDSNLATVDSENSTIVPQRSIIPETEVDSQQTDVTEHALPESPEESIVSSESLEFESEPTLKPESETVQPDNVEQEVESESSMSEVESGSQSNEAADNLNNNDAIEHTDEIDNVTKDNDMNENDSEVETQTTKTCDKSEINDNNALIQTEVEKQNQNVPVQNASLCTISEDSATQDVTDSGDVFYNSVTGSGVVMRKKARGGRVLGGGASCFDPIAQSSMTQDEILQQKIDFEIKMRDGTAKLLAASKHPSQSLEAAKNLLTSNTRILTYMSELQRRKNEQVMHRNGSDEGSAQICKAKVCVSDLRIPLMWKETDYFKNKGDHRRFAVFCMVRLGAELYDSSLVKDVDSRMTDISFDDIINFNDIGHDFELTVEIYSHKMGADHAVSSTPRKIKKRFSEFSTSVGRRLSGLKDDHDQMSHMIVGPKFEKIAEATLTLSDVSDTVCTYNLTMHDKHEDKDMHHTELPLFGNICSRIAAQPECMLKPIISSQLGVRRHKETEMTQHWAMLKDQLLSFYNSPAQCHANSTPALTIPVNQTTKLLETTTEGIEMVEISNKTARVRTRYLLQADDVESTHEWFRTLHRHITNQVSWQHACDIKVDLNHSPTQRASSFIQRKPAQSLYAEIEMDSPMTRILNRLNIELSDEEQMDTDTPSSDDKENTHMPSSGGGVKHSEPVQHKAGKKKSRSREQSSA